MSQCLCCDSSLLRHIRGNTVYWYCPSCRQEMPEADAVPNCQVSAAFRRALAKKPALLTRL